MVDRLITDARIVESTGVTAGDIAIDDGTIAAIGPEVGQRYDADDRVDADGMVTLPGVVDVHNHMHDEALFPDGIDFDSQTASAVAGGVTTVVELPTQTPVTSPEAFREKRETCEELSHVDFGLVAGNVEDAAIDIDGILNEGTRDFKTFTAEPYLADDATIVELMAEVGAAGGKVRVHCETQGILDHARAKIEGTNPEVYPDSRPLEAELDAINRVGWFAEYADCPLHVVHVSSGSGAREGGRFKSRANVPVTLETCPHYLAFSDDDVEELGPFLKVNPSLKSSDEVERLWDAVQDGTIDLVASEHFPTYREERERGWEDIWEPYAGLPSIETMLEFLVSEGVHEDRLTWPRLAELVCARPAREAGVYPQKGSLRVGTDADVVLLRRDSYEVSADDLAFVGGWTPYEGRQWTARVDTVIADGEVAARNHRVLSSPGDGDFLAREPLR
ncbi:dihydroorotase [Halorussus salinisoli]|uniref:dihydroorotase n=1 Tax=Halorussus salinisoli TaxID=2558242 RepID=UPI0010C1C21B|nr:amidohydrolase family protein [Halorussus salinisoli]